MKADLETFPKLDLVTGTYNSFEVDKWKENFTKELQQIDKQPDCSKHPKWIMYRGEIYVKKKEILGE